MLTVLAVLAAVALTVLVLAAVLAYRHLPEVRRQAILADELRAAAQLEAVTRATLLAMRQVARDASRADR